jgi:glycosyltransferase involved in cell wall biosynthesis
MEEIETKVSAIVSTYDRYDHLVKCIDSVKNQTYRKLEIIVVDDCSKDERYRNGMDGVKWIRLKENTRMKFGFPCLGHVRNVGIENATGEYLAFLDDDDYWMREKIELQVKAIRKQKVKMCCTEGWIGDSIYDEGKEYALYNREHYRKYFKRFFKKHYGREDGLMPELLNYELINRHNCIIHSSVLIDAELVRKVGGYKHIKLGGMKMGGRKIYEDWELWKDCLRHTDCYYIDKPLFYYDGRFSEKRRAVQ